MNPGIQVSYLYVGVASKANPRLVKETTDVAPFGLKNSQILSGGANPNFAYAITTSGSLVLLDPA